MSRVETNEKHSALMQTYGRFPVTITRGEGSYVWDEDGNRFLDYTSGIATCNLGHVPEKVTAAVKKQLDTLWHCSNLYHIPVQEELASILTENSVFDQVFFCNSGAEANEAAIKIAKKYAKDRGNPERFEIVTFKQSFHGRTGTTLAATGQEKIQEGFAPLASGFRYLTFNDMEALNEVHNGKTTAVLLELVQGEGGVNTVDSVWIKQLESICREYDILLMIDEVQTGMGRTGSLFAYEQFDIEPDVISLAKALGSGFPIGAILAKEQVATSFTPGTHGSTFGGNPLVATAGVATMKTIIEDDIINHVKEIEMVFKKELASLQKKYKMIQSIKGKGLLIGIEMEGPAADYVTALRKKNVLALMAGERILRILPPLTTTTSEVYLFIEKLEEVLIEKSTS